MKKELGQFEIESGNVRVSDPCYDKITWCNGLIRNVKKGKWNSYITLSDEEDWGTRVATLVALNNSIKNQENLKWQQTNIHVGVDSGQAGIYDDKYFKDDNVVKEMSTKYNESNLVLDTPDVELALEIDFELKLARKILKVHTSDTEKDKSLIKDTKEKIKKREQKIREDADKRRVKKIEWRHNNNRNLWYDINCVTTLGVGNKEGIYHKDDILQKHGGIIPFGTVSRSGYGDGSYSCDVVKENDEIVAIRIVFIDTDDFE